MELKVKIYKIKDEQVVSDKFKKREFVVNTDLDTEYPQRIQLEFIQDKCEFLNGYKVDDIVTVHINIKGREWFNPEGKAIYFNTLQAWRIEKDEQQQEQSQVEDKEADDLPF